MDYILIAVAVLLHLYALIMIIRVKRKYYISPNISFKRLLKTTTDERLRRELKLINVMYWLSGLFVLLFFVVFILT